MNIYKFCAYGVLLLTLMFSSCFVIFGNDGIPLWERVLLAVVFEIVAVGVVTPLMHQS
jgi:hypothetical protein